MPFTNAPRGFVYIAWNPVTDLYKVGGTRLPVQRLKQLRRDVSKHVVMLNMIDSSRPASVERIVHGFLFEFHEYGDWFRLMPSYAATWETVCNDAKKADRHSDPAYCKKMQAFNRKVCGAHNLNNKYGLKKRRIAHA